DLEQVAALKPDLIVGADWLDPADQSIPYEQLSVIAPTALFEWRQAAGNWPVEAAGVAAALGKEAQMDALREDYEAYAAEINETYAGQLAAFTWDLVSATPSNWYLYGPSSSHGQVAAAAGVKFGAAATQGEGYIEESLERFDLLANTDVLMAPMPGEGGLDVLDDVPTFQSLPALRNGRTFATAYFFPSSYGLSTAFLGDVAAALKTLSSD
ncbi:MAG: ABC transporter substrate-binding protein, partial [Thermomicrobiales bacterium]